MGDRGNICMKMKKGGEIYFYTHWEGSNLAQALRSALIRGRDRWKDESYLARIIFSELIQDDILDTCGYGISTYLTDNEHDILYVDVSKQLITLRGKTYTLEEFLINNDS